MKLRKRFAAMCAAAVMALGTLGIEANALSSISLTITSYTENGINKKNYAYEYTDINTSNHYTNYDVSVSYADTYTISFSPSYGGSTSYKLYKYGNSTPTASFVIPTYAPGMPTLSTSAYLYTGSYRSCFKAVSGTTSGTLTLKGIR